MLSILDTDLKRFHDRVISRYDYSIYFRIIDLTLATIISIIPLLMRDVTGAVAYTDGLVSVLKFMVVFTVIGHF
jgi:hypothetical protein